MKRYRWNMIPVLSLLCLLCIHSVMFPVKVSAAEGDRMEIGTDGILILRSQQAADAGASSLQFTMKVSADNLSSIVVDFVPDGKLNAKVVESFWHTDTGELRVYVAGSGRLFDNGQTYTLTLGRVTATDGSGKAVQIGLSADAGSLCYVTGTELVAMEDLTVPAEPVVLNAGATPGSGSSTGTAGSTGAGSTGTTETGNWGGISGGQGTASTGAAGAGQETGSTGNKTDLAQSAGGQTTGEDAQDTERNLHTWLQTVLNTAERLHEQDYTSESYQILKEAIERAEALLNAPDASREEVEEAILALENAMGSLVDASDTTVESVSDMQEMVQEEKEGGFKIVLLVVIIAAVLGIGGVVLVQVRDGRDAL